MLNLIPTEMNQVLMIEFSEINCKNQVFPKLCENLQENKKMKKKLKRFSEKNLEKKIICRKNIVFFKILEIFISENKIFENGAMAVWI